MARRNPRVVDTKQRILDAALALFGERGYHKVSADEIAARDEAIRMANRGATMVPLEVLERNLPVLDLAAEAVAKGNPNSLSDGGVAALCCAAAAEGAYYNVLINLAGIEGDEEWAASTKERADKGLAEVQTKAGAITEDVRKRLLEDLA